MFSFFFFLSLSRSFKRGKWRSQTRSVELFRVLHSSLLRLIEFGESSNYYHEGNKKERKILILSAWSVTLNPDEFFSFFNRLSFQPSPVFPTGARGTPGPLFYASLGFYAMRLRYQTAAKVVLAECRWIKYSFVWKGGKRKRKRRKRGGKEGEDTLRKQRGGGTIFVSFCFERNEPPLLSSRNFRKFDL